MSNYGIPLDKAELLSAVLEALLYGFSLLMFGGTICVLWSKRSTHRVNHRMVTVACLLLLFSTVHIVIDIIRIMEGLILYRDTYPEGPVGFFSDVSQWTFVYKNYVYTAQTLLGDGVILYRCYAVWQSKLVMILPALLWCAVGVTGIGSPYTASRVTQNEVFGGSLSQWITSFYASTFTTNLLTTLLLAYRIWSVDRRTARLCGHRKSYLRPVLHVIIDAGVIYSVTLFAALVCFVNQSNIQYVILDTITPIISITFYMVIIRVGLANRANQLTTLQPLTTEQPLMTEQTLVFASTGNGGSSADRRRSGMQVHITTLTESKVEHDQRSSMRPMTPMGSENKPQSEMKFNGAGEVA